MSAPTLTDVLDSIRDWPEDTRLALAYRILQSVVEQPAQPAAPAPRKRTLQHALGLLASDTPAPDDEQVRQWLDEHREEKYG